MAAGPRAVTRRHVLPPALALVLVVAAALKLLELLLSRSSPFYQPTVLDAKYYHEWALRIAGGDLLGDGVFYGLPLYPYFLAACYALVGPVVLVPKLVQVALGVVTIFLVYEIGERLDTAATGLVAAALAALYGPLLFHETLLVPESLAVPLYAAGLFLCCVFLERPSLGRGALVGFVLGVACLTKAGAILFVLGFALVCLLRPNGPGGRLVVPVLALMLAFLTTLAPVTMHNVLWGRDTVLLTSHAGFNFYVGNNPHAQGVFVAPEGTGASIEAQIIDSRVLAETAAGRPLRPSEVSRYWSDRAWRHIGAHPADFVRLSVRKLLLLFDARELSDVEDYAHAQEFNRFFVVPWLGFAVIGPLALVGLIAGIEVRRFRSLLRLWVATYLAGVVMFFVNARYRLPLMSLWLVLAAVGARRLVGAAREGAWSRLARWTSVLVIGVALTQLRLVDIDPATGFVHAGDVYLTRKDHERARVFYAKAIAANPENAEAYLGMGIVLAQLGRLDEARAHYERSIAITPDARAYSNLGASYEQAGNSEAAERAYAKAIEVKPYWAPPHNNLGISYARRGEHARAVEEFEAAVKYDPQNWKAHINLGLVLRAIGRGAEARQQWEAALAINPQAEEARRALGEGAAPPVSP